MCGIAGFISSSHRDDERLRAVGNGMADALAHRGPDGAGVWTAAAQGVALGHRRLSVLDLSEAGSQPMTSASGRFTIVYNGEIYSSPQMRAALPDVVFRGASDTETLLEAIEAWGLDMALKQSVGMFAFALWDSREGTLHLVRDRLGIKPLYYGWVGDDFVFGSELKALLRHPDWCGQIDRDAVAAQLEFSYIPAPRSIYEGVYKLMPGTGLSVVGVPDRAGFSPWPPERGERSRLQPWSWWDARAVYAAGLRHPFSGTEADALAQLDELLHRVVRDRLVSDVPLGAFLSGGIDSSIVVALMCAAAPGAVRTFSIGFHDAAVNEAPYARAVAEHLGTRHTELYVSAARALAMVPELPQIYDEPFSDSSQIPTTLLSRMTRDQVTVALSGDGGDEVFCGYNRYDLVPRIWARTQHIPHGVRRRLAAALMSLPIRGWEAVFRHGAAVLPERLTRRAPGEVVEKLATSIGARDADTLYRALTQSWRDTRSLVPGSRPVRTPMNDPALALNTDDLVRRMMYGDLLAYLPDDILVKVDRASMSASLEARVPLLDHRLVEFAAGLPVSWLSRHGESKRPLRRVLERFVPAALIDRPKQGFAIPLGAWLRGPLREWAEDLLNPARLRREGYLEAEPISRAWRDHVDGRRDGRRRLWDVLMFQAWLDAR